MLRLGNYACIEPRAGAPSSVHSLRLMLGALVRSLQHVPIVPATQHLTYITKAFVYTHRHRAGWPASLPYMRKICVSMAIDTQSEIRLHKRVPIVKYGGPQKMTKIK